MLDVIRKEISTLPDSETKIHKTREFLQLLMLKAIYDKGYFRNLSFVGGTALRFLYNLRRFSEDLDFSLINNRGYKFDVFLERVAYELEKAGFATEIKKNPEGVIHSAMFKFREVLYLLGLSKQKSQKLFIKMEIDANPPEGWNTELSLVNRYFVFSVLHFDLASLYATKLHACFFRKYTKGRDFYDLIWYFGKRILPNFELLNNAIEQTQHQKMNLNAENFNDFLKEKLARINFVKVRKDVEAFIEDKSELRLLDRDLILKLIG